MLTTAGEVKSKLTRDVVLWTPPTRRTSVVRSAENYIHNSCVDIGYNVEDLLRTMADIT